MQDVLDKIAQRPADAIPARTLGGPVVLTRGLQKHYGRTTPVLTDVTLEIRDGERVALIGANGCGKSTLLKSLIGLHPITGGEVEILGQTFGTQPSAKQRSVIRKSTGFVFQKHCLVRRRSVLSNVIHGMLGAPGSWRAFSQSTAPQSWRDVAMAALHEVNLVEFAGRRADALSGGQQQRVAIARALIRRPRLLIADEPAASLDPASGRDVMEHFTRLAQQHGITLVFTTHDMDHAREFSDRTIALRRGRVFIDRRSEDITARDLEETFDG
ncbi:MAG: ATP-binding cassette domain-containing protein [Pseudomonadota bacterium]